jgi:hypothetical protein
MSGMLHAIATVDLLHDQLGVGVDAHAAGPLGEGVAQRVEQGLVFGDVVRGASEIAVELGVRAAVLAGDVDAEGGLPRVAAAGAVDVDLEAGGGGVAHGSGALTGVAS